MNAVTIEACQEPAVHIVPLSAGDEAAWDRFVREHPKGTFFHLAGWQTVLQRAFGHATHYLIARTSEGVQGVLPLARVRSRLFGDALISTPFCVYGGALATTAKARHALQEFACDLARTLAVDYLELRNRERTRTDWPCKDLYVTFRKTIDYDPQANLIAIPRKQRAVVRKGIAAGLEGEIDTGVERLYHIYSDSLRNLGTPVFSRRYLEILREVFASECEIQTVSTGGEALASVLSFYFRDEVLPYYGGGTARARMHFANDFMYWELMRRSAERGARTFDFGRSKRESGSYQFKIHWGFEPQPLYYEYFLVRAARMPDLSPSNPSYRALIGAWKRMPLWATQLLGPPLARYLG